VARLRIGFDASGLASGKPPTGLERYTHALLRELAARRDEDDLELFVYLASAPLPDRWDLSGLAPGPALHWRVAPLARGWYRVGMGLAMWLDRIAVMHFPAPHIARYCPARSVVTIHDLAAMSLENAVTEKERLYLADARDAGRRASSLIAVSASAGAEIERYLERRDYAIIHEGVDLERFRPASPQAIAELRAEHNLPPYILYVGTLQARKNHLRLFDAFESIADRIPHTLVLVGRDGSGAQAVHERLAQRPNPRIRLMGFVPEAQLPALYSGADALVLPSLWEGFGLPILEAMACDTPVLTSNLSSLVEIAGDAALTVDPRNVEDLADKLHGIVSDDALRERLRQRGRERVKAFSWRENARRTIEVYRRTANQAARR
jgi:glycosyltransferase involved in cell wall biosynthesis